MKALNRPVEQYIEYQLSMYTRIFNRFMDLWEKYCLIQQSDQHNTSMMNHRRGILELAIYNTLDHLEVLRSAAQIFYSSDDELIANDSTNG